MATRIMRWPVRSAGHVCKTAAAIERQNRRTDEEAAQAEGVPRRITFRIGSLYDLWSDSDRPKFGVRIFGEVVLRDKTVDRIDGRSSEEFMGPNGSRSSTRFEITWRRREACLDEPQRRGTSRPTH
jgi:hypothetical protein